jgi:hypothetical protein
MRRLVVSAVVVARGATHRWRRPACVQAVKAFDSTATINGTAWFRWMYRHGYRLYVMHSTEWGTCTPWPQAETQLRNALAVGLKVAAYTGDPSCWQGGIEAAGSLASELQFFALDVETDPGLQVTREVVDGVEALGVRPVVYSGSGMWPQVMGADDSFADVALWDTDVTGTVNPGTWRPNLMVPAAVPYGGWNVPGNPRVMVQQAFNVSLNGVVVDVNSVAAGFLRTGARPARTF